MLEKWKIINGYEDYEVSNRLPQRAVKHVIDGSSWVHLTGGAI